MSGDNFAAVITHLWQSTLFAGAIWLLTLALRRNRAAIRHALWLAASIKFLIPLSWFIRIGESFSWAPATQPPAAAALSQAMTLVFEPQVMFGSQLPTPAASSSGIPVAAIALGIWLAGGAIVLFTWWRAWHPVRVSLRQAQPMQLANAGLPAGLRVMSSPDRLEPGIVGIWRPILILPDQIADRLSPSEFQTVIAHELCHVRRRDNLVASLHMLVEALFWFHPLVWWIERRLVDERERACDEDVVWLGSEPATYAQAILSVCRLYTAAPSVCASAVTGSDLRKRIEAIMTNHAVLPMDLSKRALLAVAVALAVGLPVVMGALHAAPGAAQTARQFRTNDPLNATFEVFSIKPNNARDGEREGDLVGSRFWMRYATLHDLVQFSYPRENGNLRNEWQIIGGPEWITDAHFNVEGRAEGTLSDVRAANTAAGAATPGEIHDVDIVRAMVRAALAERFKLTVHHEQRDLPMYSLVRARGDGALGPRLRQVDIDCVALRKAGVTSKGPGGTGCGGFQSFGPGRRAGHAVPLSFLAALLEGPTGRNVADQTGLSGVFDVELQWTPMPAAGPDTDPSALGDANAPSLFTAVKEQLGLKLEPIKGPVDVIVIDHAELPTPN